MTDTSTAEWPPLLKSAATGGLLYSMVRDIKMMAIHPVVKWLTCLAQILKATPFALNEVDF